jgi:tetratricopeptide (TPR) repeat protein
LVGIGFAQMRNRPMLSFGLLFFFLNHLVESSIIGLELIFEHRNYLPSLFLFTPVAVGLQWLIDRYRALNFGFQYVIISFIILLVTGFGAGTYIRNMAWSDAKTFWEDAADKAPFSSRPLHNLAFEHYQKTGQHKQALALYLKALRLNDYNRKSVSVVHNNIAVHHLREGNPRKAIEHLEKAQAGYPKIETFQYLHALALFQTQDYYKALHILDTLLSERPSVFNHLLLKAKILLHLDRVEEALAQLRWCVKLAPDSAETLSLIGAALNLQGHYKRAELFLRRVLHRFPNDKTTLLRMADCRLQANDKATATVYISKFLNQLPVGQIESALEKALGESFFSPDFRDRLYRLILQQATEQMIGILEAHRVKDSLISELRSHD